MRKHIMPFQGGTATWWHITQGATLGYVITAFQADVVPIVERVD